MSDISQWDPIDGNNSNDPPDGFPEGQPAASLNDACRAVMGGVRRQWEDKEWFDWGHTISYQSTTVFLALGDQSAVYKVGRPVRCVGTLTGTIYGEITDVSTVTDTTVTCLFTAGSLVTELDGSEVVSVGTDPDVQSVAAGSIINLPAAESIPLGTILPYAASGPPVGWLLCDGAAVSRTTYANLFTLIGTTYGSGDGSTTFNVPDLVGRSPVGFGQSPDAGEGGGVGVNRTLGTKDGAETHSLTIGQMPGHTHSSPYTATGPQEDGGGTAAAIPIPGTGPATGSAGGNGSHNNVSPVLAIQFIIKN